MSRIVALIFAAAASLPGNAAPLGDDVPHEFRGATITSYGEMPAAGSGILMILRWVSVTTANGETRKLHFIHGGVDRDGTPLFLGSRNGEPYPAIGSKCDFETVPRHIANDMLGDGGPSGPVGEVINVARC